MTVTEKYNPFSTAWPPTASSEQPGPHTGGPGMLAGT